MQCIPKAELHDLLLYSHSHWDPSVPVIKLALRGSKAACDFSYACMHVSCVCVCVCVCAIVTQWYTPLSTSLTPALTS